MSTNKLAPTSTVESKVAMIPVQTNPGNIKFIAPYNADHGALSAMNSRPSMAAPVISSSASVGNEMPGPTKFGEVATVTVNLSTFNVALVLEENARHLEEWGKLLDKTENWPLEKLSSAEVQRHAFLKRKLHENLGIMAKLVQTQLKQKRLDETNAAATTVGTNVPGEASQGNSEAVETKVDEIKADPGAPTDGPKPDPA